MLSQGCGAGDFLKVIMIYRGFVSIGFEGSLGSKFAALENPMEGRRNGQQGTKVV